jgi:hypothetical protein
LPEAHERQQIDGLAAILGNRPLAKFDRQQNVLQDRPPRQQNGRLKHDRRLATGTAQRLAGERQRTACTGEKACKQPQQCRFPATARTHQRNKLAFGEIEGHRLQRGDAA